MSDPLPILDRITTDDQIVAARQAAARRFVERRLGCRCHDGTGPGGATGNRIPHVLGVDCGAAADLDERLYQLGLAVDPVQHRKSAQRVNTGTGRWPTNPKGALPR